MLTLDPTAFHAALDRRFGFVGFDAPPAPAEKNPVEPRQPCSITMPVALQLAIIRRAKTEDRSFSATVRRAVERYLTAS